MIKLIKIIYFIILSFYFLFLPNVNAQEKIKIGLLVPMTGENKEIGESIIKAVGLAVKDIDNDLIEIYPKDTATKANQTLKSAFELSEMGIKIVIGPVFYESLTYLDEMKNLTFLSLTNKTLNLPKNVISAGINSTSQFNTIKKFLETNQIQRTIFLTPIQDYEFEAITNENIENFDGVIYLKPNNDEKNFIFKNSSIYLALNTKNESFGITLIEAINSGNIVISSDLAAFKDVLEESGIYYERNSYKSLLSLLTNTLKSDLHFLWEKLYGTLHKILV